MSNLVAIPRIDKMIREESMSEDALDVIKIIRPEWIQDRDQNGVEIKVKMFTDGITNKLIGFSVPNHPRDVVMIRVYGANTDLMIDRQAEINTMTLLHEKNYGPKMYAMFHNGFAYEYLHGETLSMESCWKPEVYSQVAAAMARLHRNIPLSPQQPGQTTQVDSNLWNMMNKFYSACEECLEMNEGLGKRLLAECGFSLERAKDDIAEIRHLVAQESIPVAFCHNDILLGNVILDKEMGKVYFIDFEYASSNYIAFDVAHHFNEFAGINDPDFSKCPDRKFRAAWISQYLKHYGMMDKMEEGFTFTQEDFERWVDVCIPAAHLLWTLWAIVQAHYSTIDFDYASYVGLRYVEYKRNMEEIKRKYYASQAK